MKRRDEYGLKGSVNSDLSEIERIYHKQGYRLLGRNRHSAVKICRWTRESLRSNRVCYKELWYPPVQSHRCMEMTPYIGCNCHCLYCWRIHSGDRPGLSWREFPLKIIELDDPEVIVEDAIEKRRDLLIGFKGNPKVDRKKLEEALKPTMMTMSLTGEPTLYPYISGLVEEAKKRGIITFLVTNGTMPKALERMDPLPFQLYVSLSAPDKKTYIKVVRPLIRDAWKKVTSTLDILPSLETRRVIRLTMIKGLNMLNYKGYAELIEKAEPDFIEVKAYEWVGESQRRLGRESMPFMKDIREAAEKISDLTGYEVRGEYEPSGAVLLA